MTEIIYGWIEDFTTTETIYYNDLSKSYDFRTHGIIFKNDKEATEFKNKVNEFVEKLLKEMSEDSKH